MSLIAQDLCGAFRSCPPDLYKLRMTSMPQSTAADLGRFLLSWMFGIELAGQ